MAQCQNFFDDKSPSSCKSSSSNEQQYSPASTTVDGNADGDDSHLQLRLGPSVEVSRPPKQHEMVRPIPLYPSIDRQRSGNYGNSTGSSPLFRGRSDISLAEKALFSKDSAFSTPSLISRDQVWQSLQNSNAVLGHESHTSKAFCDDAGSSLLGRRSASMQLLMPSNETTEVGACAPLRRSCSNGVPLSRQSSFGQEALVDESPDATNSMAHHHQQDALELQKKKEMQAHRRLEARKRRRLLLDKQQKKARQNNGPNNRQSILPVEKAPLICLRSSDGKYSLKFRGLSEDMAAKLEDDEDIKRENQVKDAYNGVTSLPLQRANESQKSDSHKAVEKVSVCESTNNGSKCVQGELSSVQQMIASCNLSALSGHKEDFPQAGKNAEMYDAAKTPHSCCSETESTESKEKEMDSSERESSSQKSSTENHLDYGVSATVSTPSKPMLYPRSFPGASLVNTRVQANSSLCRSPRLPPLNFGGTEGSHAWQSSPCEIPELSGEEPSNFTIKRSVGVFSEGKWRIPDEDSAFPSIRRTASNINEAMPEPHRPAKELETYASLSASQLKFAGTVFNNVAGASSTKRSDESQRCFSSNLHPHGNYVKKEPDVLTGDEKTSAFGAMGPAMVGATLAPLTVTTPVKVKQEEDAMDDKISKHHFARDSLLHLGCNQMENEPIKRQTSASFPELPWVTTTGRGPNGRTINGVMYITGGRSVRLVCRCHGKHMSPAEFVEHAGSTDLSNPLRNIVVNSPMVNHLASTPV